MHLVTNAILLLHFVLKIVCKDVLFTDPLYDLENDIVSLQNVGNIALRNIRTNLIINRVFNDDLNLREFRNMYICWKFAFNEIVSNLNITSVRRSLPAQNRFAKAKKLADHKLPPNIDTNEVLRIVLQMEKIAKLVKLPYPGEFVQAVDTLAHFVQTRFQHDRKHADLYANVSTILIRTIISQNQFEINLTKSITILLVEVRKIAALIQKDFEVNPNRAHIELFIGGLNNILSVFVNAYRQNSRAADDTFALALQRQIFQHLTDSIFEGRKHVKQALAVQALYFKKHVEKLGYSVHYRHLASLSNFAYATSSEIKREFSLQVLLATSSLNNTYLALIQSLNVQMQNIFRLSHEESLQGLFLHLSHTVMQTSDINQEDVIDVLQQILIETYRTKGGIDLLTEYFRELLIFFQLRLLKTYFHIP